MGLINIKFRFVVLLVFISKALFAYQDPSITNIIDEIKTEKNDSIRARLLGKLSYVYQYVDFNKSIYYADSALKLSKKINYQKGIAKSYNFLGLAYSTIGKLDLALQNYLMALRVNENAGIEQEMAKNMNNIGEILVKIGDDKKGVEYILKAYKINKKYGNKNSMAISLSLMSDVSVKRKEFKNALTHLKEARAEAGSSIGIFDDGFYFVRLGEIFLKAGKADSARSYFQKALNIKKAEPDQKIASLYGLSIIEMKFGDYKKSKIMLNEAMEIAKLSNAQFEFIKLYKALSDLSLKTNDLRSAVLYIQKRDDLKDSLLGYKTSGKISGSLNTIITEQKEAENERLRLESKLRENELSKQKSIVVILTSGILVAIILSMLAYRNFKSKNRAYKKLNIANETINQYNINLEEKIEKRTTIITNQNKKLKELAYFNSHTVRRHLANILGLIHLMKDEKEKQEYFDMIESEANSLDHIVKDINQMIESKS